MGELIAPAPARLSFSLAVNAELPLIKEIGIGKPAIQVNVGEPVNGMRAGGAQAPG
ncbi:hypothetical protein ACIOHO_07050 [Streptomyces sp. NPDC087849]|uniref:hypothetical protein n=1 Tax=Streptomyces sp. NPDC087849 TaxID=3365808 RepID=UPI0038254EF3